MELRRGGSRQKQAVCRLSLKYGQSDIVQILLLNYGQEKHKSDIVQVLRNKGRVDCRIFKMDISLAHFD